MLYRKNILKTFAVISGQNSIEKSSSNFLIKKDTCIFCQVSCKRSFTIAQISKFFLTGYALQQQQQWDRSPPYIVPILNSGSWRGFSGNFLEKLFLYSKIKKRGGEAFLFFRKHGYLWVCCCLKEIKPKMKDLCVIWYFLRSDIWNQRTFFLFLFKLGKI